MSDAMITRRGGGVNLNFRITQYSEGTDMSRIIGKPNEIAVMTENKIDGWQFSYEEPENPTTGMVWIKLANTGRSMFNALKKNAIILGGAVAHQYLTGEWQPKHAQIYQNGGWNDFRHYLFREGMGQIVQWRDYNNATFTDDSITVKPSNGAAIRTFDKFDFSPYSKLFLDYTPYMNGYNSYQFGITFTTKNTGYSDLYSSTQGYAPTGCTQNQQYPCGTAPNILGVRATIELEITDATKEAPQYLGFAGYWTDPTYIVHNVWLE